MQLLEFRFLKFYTTTGVGWRGGALKSPSLPEIEDKMAEKISRGALKMAPT